MHPKVLFNCEKCFAKEAKFAAEFFDVFTSRVDLPCRNPANGLEPVLVRYLHWPHGYELERDLAKLGYQSVNAARGWDCIMAADWLNLLGWDLTPRTWFLPEQVAKDELGPFVVRGFLRSNRQRFKEMMFAPDRASAIRLWSRISVDPYWGEGGAMIRRFIELESSGMQISGLPLAYEWRVFVLDGEVIASGDYWSEIRDCDPLPVVSDVLNIARRAAQRLLPALRFAAIDVARTTDGQYLVIEVNHGGMAGLNGANPEKFYASLAAGLCARGL